MTYLPRLRQRAQLGTMLAVAAQAAIAPGAVASAQTASDSSMTLTLNHFDRNSGLMNPQASSGIDIGRQPPGGRVGSNRSEHLTLVAQQSQVGDALAAVGEHDCQVGRDPSRVVPGSAGPKSAQRVGEDVGQAGGTGEIGQQARSGMADRPPTIGRDNKPGA